MNLDERMLRSCCYPEFTKIWKLNKKIAKLQGEKDAIIARLHNDPDVGIERFNTWYREFELGVFTS